MSKPDRNLVYGADAAADVARVLDNARIEHILWGWLALGLVGAYQRSGAIEFVVADSQMNRASGSLAAIGLKPCADTDCEAMVLGRLHPVSAVHFHLGLKYRGCTTFSCLTKSTTLWWLPHLPLLAPGADDPNLLLTTDSRLPPSVQYGCTGPWSDLYPIKISNSSSFTEAIILLACRDHRQPSNLFPTWEGMLEALRGYKEYPASILKKTLSPEFQLFWNAFLSDKSVEEVYGGPGRRLRDDLIKAGKLPPPPDYSAFESSFAMD